MKQDPKENSLQKLFQFILRFNRSLIALATLILVITGFFTYQKLESEMQKMVTKELESSLRANTEAITQWLETQEKQINALVIDPNLKELFTEVEKTYRTQGAQELSKNESFETLRKRLRNYCKETDFKEFFIINYDYQCLVADETKYVGYQLTEKNPSLSTLKNLDKTKIKLPCKPPEEFKDSGISMFVATPIMNEKNEAIAILALTLEPESTFSRVLAASRLGESGESYAINTNGWMISGSRFTEQLKKEGFLAPEEESSVLNIRVAEPEGDFTKMAASALSKEKDVTFPFIKSDIEGYPDYRGVDVVGAWTYLDKYKFALTSEIDYSEAMRPVTVVRTVNIIILALAGSFLIMIIIYSYVNGDITARCHLAEAEAKEMGQYRVLGKIGEGGMGVIYKAEHKLMKRETALKVLKKVEDLEATEQFQTRFEKEVMLSSKLTHPNTIGIYDYGTTANGKFYYAMELLDGLDLADLINKTGPISPERTIYFLLQICASLNEAHKKQLIHRDIKPQNIMVCYRGAEYDFIKVLDFGLIKELSAEATQTMTISGSPIYMSPEAITSPSKVTELTDVYSLGVTAFYMLTGRYPFDKPENGTNALFMHITETPKKPSEVVKFAIPEDLENLIMQCLEKEAADRPVSMDELAQKLLLCQDAYKWDKHKAMTWWARHPGILKTTTEKLQPATRENFDSTLKINIAKDS